MTARKVSRLALLPGGGDAFLKEALVRRDQEINTTLNDVVDQLAGVYVTVVSNTSIKLNLKGTDGTVRSVTLTLS